MTIRTPASMRLANDADKRVRAFSPASWSTMYFWPSFTTVPGTRDSQTLVSPVGLVTPFDIRKKKLEVEENASSQANWIEIPSTGGSAPNEKKRKATVTNEIHETWRIVNMSLAIGLLGLRPARRNSLVGTTSITTINNIVEGR